MAPSGRSPESDQTIKRIIIGIGGNVCSGKSTLAGAILQAFEEVCHEDCKPVGISVDDFIRYTPDPERFWTQDEYPTSLSAVDWVGLNNEITRVINGKAVKPYNPLVLHDKRSNDRVQLNKTELKRHLTQLGHILKDDKIQIVVVEGSQLCMKGDQDGWPNGRAKPSSLGQEPIMDDEQKRARDKILDRFLFRYYLYATKSRSRDRVFRYSAPSHEFRFPVVWKTRQIDGLCFQDTVCARDQDSHRWLGGRGASLTYRHDDVYSEPLSKGSASQTAGTEPRANRRPVFKGASR